MEWSAFELHLRHLPERDHKRVRKAYDMARKLHEGQKRKSGEPYFMHPVAVAKKLADVGADAETIIAALLHDTVEDTQITLDDIHKEFGDVVTKLINGVTKLSSADIGTTPSLNEQTETLRKIFHLMQEDPRIMIIKLYDRLHNMETVSFLSEVKQRALAEETFDAYAKIADRLCMQDMRYELEELCYQVLDPELLHRMKELRDENEALGQKLFSRMGKVLEKDEHWSNISMEVENKTWGKLQAQLNVEGKAVSGLSSVTIAFICPDRDSCYHVMGALHKPWRREELSFQDFINSPQPNGYRGLHTTVILEDGTRVRCKIRTQEMQHYAHSGATLYCFDEKKKQTLETLLPWTQRLQALTQDATHRSDAFWQNLQNDILGESITVHGPDDKVVQLPKNSTALDGALYLFGDLALRAKTVRVNGKDVLPRTTLQRSNSVSIVVSRERQVEREWLQWVRTGYAMAVIRNALSAEQTFEEKLKEGRIVLNDYLARKGKGFIEEFDQQSISHSLRDLNAANIDDVYASLADGRLAPSEVYTVLFERGNSKKEEERKQSIIRYMVNMEDSALMERIGEVHRQHSASLNLIRYRRGRNPAQSSVSLRVHMTDGNKKKLIDQLERAGAENVSSAHTLGTFARTMSLIALIALWGIDPVIARSLLVHLDVNGVNLTLVRMCTLTVLSASILMIHRIRAPLPEIRLSLRNSTLWLTSILFLLIATCTYLALETTTPSQYTIPMTAAGVVLTTIQSRRRWPAFFTWAFILLGTALLIFLSQPMWAWSSIILTLASVAAFATFWLVSERYKASEMVGIRTAQFFFVLCAISTVFSLGLLPFSTVMNLPTSSIFLMILFCLVFVGLPYCITFYALSVREHLIASQLSFVVIPITMAAEYLVFGPVSGAVLIASLVVCVGAVAPQLLGQENLKK